MSNLPAFAQNSIANAALALAVLAASAIAMGVAVAPLAGVSVFLFGGFVAVVTGFFTVKVADETPQRDGDPARPKRT